MLSSYQSGHLALSNHHVLEFSLVLVSQSQLLASHLSIFEVYRVIGRVVSGVSIGGVGRSAVLKVQQIAPSIELALACA